MIERYTRKDMGDIWQLKNRFQKMLAVEIAVAKAQASLGIIPKKAAANIEKKGKVSVSRIAEIEKVTRHDVIAFVSNVAENVGPDGRYVHFGLTSSDVLDTALSLQFEDAAVVLRKSFRRFERALTKQVKAHAETLCAGRTHGMHAEPTSFGLKLAGFLAEFKRNTLRFERALDQVKVVKLSGAVGTYSVLSQQVESKVGRLLKLRPEVIATQVVPRDRHAEVMQALAFAGAGLERLAVELRHLQRTEVYEVLEGFKKGQKGSSAMPHKKNPISSENITGVARLLRSYAQASMENIALWHERDISHSSVERVTFPDAFILLDYAVDRMADVVENFQVNATRMRENMDLSKGQLFSSHLLLEIINCGHSREEAYAKVQSLSHGLKNGETLEQKVLEDKQLVKEISKKKIKEVFSGVNHKKSIRKVIDRVLR